METDPFKSLLSALGDPMTTDKLKVGPDPLPLPWFLPRALFAWRKPTQLPFYQFYSLKSRSLIYVREPQRTLRAELLSTIDLDWTTKLPSIEEKLKGLSSIPTASRDPNWHARIHKLLQSAANKIMEHVSKNPFVALAREIGLTMKVPDLQVCS